MEWLLEAAYWLTLGVRLPRLSWYWATGREVPAELGRAFGWVPPRSSDRPCAWLHGASLGELNVLTQVLPELEQRFSGWDFVIATSSASGYDLAQQRFSRYPVIYCPWDLPRSTATALDRIRPDALVMVEFDRRPMLVAAARERGIPLTMVNARICSRHQRFCRRWPVHAKRMLQAFDSILLQTPADAAPFLAHGVEPDRLAIGGALKFDHARPERNNFATRKLAKLAGFRPDDVVLLAGSTRRGEDELIIRVYQKLVAEFPRLRLVLVPRNACRFDTACQRLKKAGIRFQRRSELDRNTADSAARALVVDTFGELAAWWGTATIGFVGNSLSRRGGQNMIEPAAYGVATCFGPHTENFRDVVDMLLADDAAVVVQKDADVLAFVRKCLEEPAFAADLGQRAQTAVARQCGALERTLEHLAATLDRIKLPVIYRLQSSPAVSARRRAA